MSRSESPNYGALLREGYRTIERLQKKIEQLERARSEPVAIVGMGCRLPGGVTGPDSYWELLRDGVDAIAEIPPDRWDVARYFDADPDVPGKMSTRWGGFMDHVDRFDASFFGISPREAASMDPQQRILLEVAWEALEHAAIAPDSLMGSQTGVFIGVSTNDYSHIQTRNAAAETFDAYLATGNSHSMASGRLAYVLGLQGPTFSVDTACSSSLIAVHAACQALRAGQCTAALAGGVNLILIPEATVTLSKAQMMSRDGRCKTFSAEADGFVRGEGCGVLVLKRLSDARANGDRVLAVIRGSAINQDGRSNGLTAPNGLAQAALIRRALDDAGVTAAQVSYVEAHGTGTPLGDPIEVQALADALSHGRTPDNRLMIGSVKTNLGHLEAAAGVAGLIKVVLALQHGEIPAHLHLRHPNPHIAWDRIPIDVATARTRWAPPGRRIAGVSAFGFSGSNAHVIVEEAAQPEPAGVVVERPLHLFALSARTPSALAGLATRYMRYFEQYPEASLADVCFTAGDGRSHHSSRLALTAMSVDDVREKLAAYVAGSAAVTFSRGKTHGSDRPEVAFLFTGQGAQYPNMGRQLYQAEPTFRKALDRCATLLGPELERPLTDVLYPSAAGDRLIHETAYAQPALFALEYALAELWISWGVEPGIVAGHSVGEFVAACVAGALTLEDALRLVAARGRLMQALPRGGAMAALGADVQRVEAVMGLMGADASVSIAAINGPAATVISGAEGAVERVRARCEADGIRTQTLAVSHAFHSSAMEPMLAPFERIAGSVAYRTPRIAWISTVTGQLMRTVDSAYWSRQVREPVRFAQVVNTLRRRGTELAVEVGPSPVLLGLARECGVDSPGWIGSLRKGRDEWSEMLAGLGALYVRGAAVNWSGLYHGCARNRVALPTYPFERQRHWCTPVEPASRQPALDRPVAVHPLLGIRVRSPLPEIQFENTIARNHPSYLAEHVVFGLPIVPATHFALMALAAAKVAMPGRVWALTGVAYHEPLALREEGAHVIQTVLSQPAEDATGFRILSRTAGADKWVLHVSGRICQGRAAAADEDLTFEAVQSACADEVPVESYYDRLRQQGLAYGDSFRCIRELRCGPRQAFGRVEPGASLHGGSAGSDVHPAFLDACIQVLGAALSLDPSIDPASQTYLPVGFDALSIQTSGVTPLWSHASIREPLLADAETLVADVALFDAGGRPAGHLRGLLLKRASLSVIRRVAQPHDGSDWFYEERWEPQPFAPKAPAGGRTRGRWIVFASAEGPGAATVSELRARGEDVVEVRPGGSYTPVEGGGSNFFTIDPALPDHYVRLLDGVGRDAPCAGIVHAWTSPVGIAIGPDGLDVLACRSALYLAQAAVSRGTSPRLTFVTSGAQAASPLAGFVRSLALEQPALQAARVELETALTPADNAGVALLVTELLGAGEPEEIAFCDGRRLVRRLERVAAPSQASAAPPIASDATYLVAGGLGSLGLIVARWLVEHGARHLVLVGRHGATGAAARAVEGLERLGVRVLVACNDVADEAGMRGLMAEISATLPPLRGVIHAAGVLADGLIERLTWDSFERVLAPKARGALLLQLLTRNLPLDFFVLFSSVASLFGAPGQSNYAAANAYMDALAKHGRALGLPVLSVNWGPWEDAGMAAGAVEGHRQRWSREGVGWISAATGMAALERVLAHHSGQVAIVPIDWNQVRASAGALAQGPFLARLLPNSVTGGAAGPGSVSLRATLSNMAEASRPAFIAEWLQSTVAGVLGLPGAVLARDQEVAGLGFDSLMAMELKNRIAAAWGVTLPMARLLDRWTVATLASPLLESVRANSGETARAPVAPSASTTDDVTRAVRFHPVSHNQRSLWYIHQLEPGSAAYNVGFAARVCSPVDVSALRYAFQTLIDRHSVLRTTYVLVGDELRQAVHTHADLAFTHVDSSGWTAEALHRDVVARHRQPFDLERGPMLRVYLWTRADDDHVLSFSAHHIAVDGWSAWILLDEFRALYAARVQNVPSGLARPAVEYSDYAAAQAALLNGPEGDALWAYWRDQLAGPLPELRLPYDHPRPPFQTLAGESLTRWLSPDQYAAVARMAQQEGATPFSVVLAAYFALLHGLSGQTELIVGTPTFGRNRIEYRDLIGDCIGMVPLRTSLSGDPTCRELLERVRNSVIGALDHEEFPFVLMVERLVQRRNLGRSPIFQTLFTYQKPQRASDLTALFSPDREPRRVSFGGLQIETYPLSQQEGQFDLALEVVETGEAMAVTLKYASDLFERATAARLMTDYVRLLDALLTNPAIRLSCLPMPAAASADAAPVDAAPVDAGARDIFEI